MSASLPRVDFVQSESREVHDSGRQTMPRRREGLLTRLSNLISGEVPPLDDPREDGRQTWEQFRQEYMLIRDELAQTMAELDQATSRIDLLVTQLGAERAERSRYERFANELVTQLSMVGTIVGEAINTARHAAYKRPNVPTSSQERPDPVDQAALERIIRGEN